jgi:hypothetical protein
VEIESSEARTFRKFMSPHGERVPSPRLGEAATCQIQLYPWAVMNKCKTAADCSTAKYSSLKNLHEGPGESIPTLRVKRRALVSVYGPCPQQAGAH